MNPDVRPPAPEALLLSGANGRGSSAGAGGEPDWSLRIEKLHPSSAWRMAVVERLQQLQADLDERAGPVPRAVHTAMRAVARAAELRSTLPRWYSGVNIERTWRALHLAESVLIASSPDLAGRIPDVRASVARKLPQKDPRVQALEPAVFDAMAEPAQRALVLTALRAADDASHDAATSVRSLRNRIILFGLLLLGVNILIGWLTARHEDMLPLCIGAAADVCPTGRAVASSGDVWWLQLMGVLGASIAVVVLLLRTKPSVVPYTLTPYQAIVKIMLGAIFAVVGVLVLRTGLLQDLVSSHASLLLFALILGYSQEVGTRLLDNIADQVVQKAQPAAHPE
ncbi:hypothetical protein [Actinokineospora sp. NBRC 105648]|uniref:hypothetical protein n=1 Tax=Actinokineospora sp. NBRC 105648 TaxID=3032206 RepID=UPI0024A0D3FD|nr:hypothetical protein [Actinokineospora sp. NBRC 105648]GLZ43579.1 hypothetical protein Acsp05_72030 [Actinokineospora sp. NBRC 105648]